MFHKLGGSPFLSYPCMVAANYSLEGSASSCAFFIDEMHKPCHFHITGAVIGAVIWIAIRKLVYELKRMLMPFSFELNVGI